MSLGETDAIEAPIRLFTRPRPGPSNARHRFAAVNRPFMRIGAGFASRNRNVTTTDGLWPD